jgi:lethal(2) giant larvae protein
LVSQVTAEVYDRIVNAGIHQYLKYSDIGWPINGGEVPERPNDSNISEYEILLTGHEDGSVKFWDCSDVCLTPLLHVKTSQLFGNSDDLDQPREDEEPEDDGEPPFRKAGQFDPYSDDPRLAVKKISLCPKTGVLIIAGTAGNIVVSTLEELPITNSEGIRTTTMDLVSEHLGFIWKGHDALKVKHQLLEHSQPLTDGVEVLGVLQIKPPAAITCLALQTKWGLMSAGTAHGLVLYDFKNNRPVLHKCTLNPNDLTGAGEPISRRKSFKKSLRESFRRLRKGRSTRNTQANIPAETRPVERQIEARAVDDGMGSMIRCLTFAQTYITNGEFFFNFFYCINLVIYCYTF